MSLAFLHVVMCKNSPNTPILSSDIYITHVHTAVILNAGTLLQFRDNGYTIDGGRQGPVSCLAEVNINHDLATA